jgi:hypothetical protein
MPPQKLVDNLSDMIVDKIMLGSTKSIKDIAEECIYDMFAGSKDYLANTDKYISMFCDILVKKLS